MNIIDINVSSILNSFRHFIMNNSVKSLVDLNLCQIFQISPYFCGHGFGSLINNKIQQLSLYFFFLHWSKYSINWRELIR